MQKTLISCSRFFAVIMDLWDLFVFLAKVELDISAYSWW